MNELFQVDRVTFNEQEHTYLLDGLVYLKGVTTIMKDNGLSPDYGSIDPEVLAHAAKMGSMAHKCIEDYCNGTTVENNSLIKSFKKLKLDVNCCEYLVTDNEAIASSIDMVVNVEEGVVDLIDMKRTASYHKDALAWQLGIYKVLFEYQNPNIKVRNCYCLLIKKGLKDSIEKDTCAPLIPVQPIEDKLVCELIVCVQAGLPFEYAKKEIVLPIPQSDIDNLIVFENNLASAEMLVKQYKTQVEALREKIMAYMYENGLDKLNLGGGEYSLRKPTTRTSIDTKALKADFPEIAEKYSVVSEVKGSITFKLKNNE